MTNRRFLILASAVFLLAMVAVLSGCTTPSTEPVTPPTTAATPTATVTPPSTSAAAGTTAGHTVVSIKDFAYAPASVTIKVGTQVVWQNDGKATHTVVFDNGSVTSPDITPGGVAGHTFKKAGTFTYHCTRFPEMKGTVIVK